LSDGERIAAAEHIARLLSAWGAGSFEDLRDLLEPSLRGLDEATFRDVLERTRSAGADWGYHSPNGFIRSLSRLVIARVLESGSGLEGGEALARTSAGSAVLVGNHLSYVDVNVLDCLLAGAGHAAFADRITALVGPKVYTAPIRRLASLSFGTIKIPQSGRIASEEAVMPAREIAQIASRSLEVARERLGAGDHLLIFPEGSRSRSAALRPLLPAVARYFEQGADVMVPFAHWGTERLVPIAEDHVYPTRVHARIGPGFAIAELLARCGRRRSLLSDTLGFLIADLLPPAYRGVYGEVEPGKDEARKIASDLSGA
jgi:1-acyl-sn-glycerol-3-phosphate acyltransferase